MNNQRILIADRNSASCAQMAESFVRSGYQVETTASAADVVNKVMQKEAGLVLLGDEFNESVLVTDLVRILRKCDQDLSIILVADEVTACQERCVRQEGIFYHALKPVCTEDTEEICLAVECAFNSATHSSSSMRYNHQLH
jgi:DNA-binding NtrC family response regulator